jgi:predicted lipoprotein
MSDIICLKTLKYQPNENIFNNYWRYSTGCSAILYDLFPIKGLFKTLTMKRIREQRLKDMLSELRNDFTPLQKIIIDDWIIETEIYVEIDPVNNCVDKNKYTKPDK